MAHRYHSIAVAQYKSSAEKLPVLYVFFTFMMATKIVVFGKTVPWLLGVGAPIVLSFYAMFRALKWIRLRGHHPTDEEASRTLRSAMFLLHLSYASVVCLDVALYYHASPDQRLLLLFQLTLTTVTLFSYLFHLEAPALSLLAIGAIPPLVLLFLHDQEQVAAITVTFAALLSALVHVMRVYAREFRQFVANNISLQRLSDENLRLANLDMITGLPNRREFFRKLGEEFTWAQQNGGRIALGIADLDGFKLVNDTYGHKLGDLVLAEVGRRISAVGGDDIKFYRLGGDEFSFLITADLADDELLALGRRVIEAIQPPIALGYLTVSVGCSVGFSFFPELASDAETLLEQCDYALYAAKRGGRCRAELFTENHRQRMQEQGAVEQALRKADIEQELTPAFQPIIDIRTGKVTGFECLARWSSPSLGVVPPDAFISAAERWGLLSSISRIILEKALAAMKNWPEDTKLSFNLSASDFTSESRVQELIALVEASGIQPHRIEFELTETAFVKNFAAARANIEMLQKTGALVALDDFGAGFSSFRHLHELPLDTLKVDRRFIAQVETCGTSRNIIRSLTGLCRDLGIRCVVEGAETEAQVDVLRLLGCDLVQGYHYAQPMTADQTHAYLKQDAAGDAVTRDAGAIDEFKRALA